MIEAKTHGKGRNVAAAAFIAGLLLVPLLLLFPAEREFAPSLRKASPTSAPPARRDLERFLASAAEEGLEEGTVSVRTETGGEREVIWLGR
ncbi:MAG: hypothetical protein JXP34_20260 [Planctomycetes bacterium]|nr:hypothetical protein [Planctomycetota bacterium]